MPDAIWLWEIFAALQSQANAGLGGLIGYNFSSLEFLLKVKQVPFEYWDFAVEMLDMLTAMVRERSKEAK